MATNDAGNPGGALGGADLADNPNLIGGDELAGNDRPDGDGTPGSPRDPLAAAGVKRGRGRPRKDGSDTAAPSAGHASGNSAGKTNGKKSASLDVDLFARQIVGAHKMLAMLLKNPMLEISEQEAKSLAEAVKNVASHHSINIAPGTLAYLQLIGVCLAVYGPRVSLIVMAKNAEKKAKANTFDAATGQQV